jgi:hypothetical protein
MSAVVLLLGSYLIHETVTEQCHGSKDKVFPLLNKAPHHEDIPCD